MTYEPTQIAIDNGRTLPFSVYRKMALIAFVFERLQIVSDRNTAWYTDCPFCLLASEWEDRPIF